jgi:hypothetical protein
MSEILKKMTLVRVAKMRMNKIREKKKMISFPLSTTHMKKKERSETQSKSGEWKMKSCQSQKKASTLMSKRLGILF